MAEPQNTPFPYIAYHAKIFDVIDVIRRELCCAEINCASRVPPFKRHGTIVYDDFLSVIHNNYGRIPYIVFEISADIL